MRKSLRSSEAIVLKKINLGDSDRIYTLLTREYGKVTAAAKGVRKISSRRSGNLDSLNHIKVTFSESLSGFKSINEVETVNSFKNLKNSLDKIHVGYYFAELVNKSVEEDLEKSDVFEIEC